jgi:hypothetical protein
MENHDLEEIARSLAQIKERLDLIDRGIALLAEFDRLRRRDAAESGDAAGGRLH